MKRSPLVGPTVILFTMILAGNTSPLPADEKEAVPIPPQQAAQEAAVMAHTLAFVDAFERADAKGVAATFATNGQMSVNGETIAEGREEIEKAYAEFFKEKPGLRMIVAIDSLQLFGPNLVIEKGRSQVTSENGASPTYDQYKAVHVRQDGKWLTATAEIDQRVVTEQGDWKKELEFLSGKWSAEDETRRFEVEFEWVANGNFLKQTYKITDGDKTEAAGVQVIGWDQQARSITSWDFDSDGSHARGWWTREGDNWVIHSRGVSPTGENVQATNVITLLGKDAFRWQSTARSIAGVSQPDTNSIRVSRAKESE